MNKKLVSGTLEKAGLNLHSVFDLENLPKDMLSELAAYYPDLSSYSQLILFAHGGHSLWTKVQPTLGSVEHPIDTHSINAVTKFCEEQDDLTNFKIIYPSQKPVGLQSLGKLAGWHHTSPFRIGINKQWGSWFAYRVAVLTNSNFQITAKMEDVSPCTECTEKPCISSCPAEALGDDFSLQRCLSYRKQEDSLCKDRCIARMTCPVAKEHQYSLEQIKYHYGVSMKMIETLDM